MTIQWILISGLLLALLYAFLQRQKSMLISLAISLVSGAGIYFVLFPEQTSVLAQAVGVARGADLVFYCWIIISLIVSVNLQFKILNLQEMVTELTREIAVRTPRAPNSGAETD